MKQGMYLVLSNEPLTSNVFKMVLMGDTSAISRPGQFINIKLDGLFLRRPISICDWDEKSITIIYKVVGHGTELMSKMTGGEELDCLVGLGNGFDTDYALSEPMVIGGGVGVPPLYALCKKMRAEDRDITAILGFNTKDEVFYEEEFKRLGCKVIVTTVDGSYGLKGFVTDAMKAENYEYIFTCGPLPMLKAVYATTKTSGQFSFEERMGCGFGACMGCTCKTKSGNKRVCKEGPIFFMEDIVWEN